MGSDDIFKKRRKDREKRKKGVERPNPNSYLIVTEGEKTEKLYIKGLTTLIEEKYGGRLDVVDVPQFEISGEGKGTISLVNQVEKLINKGRINYQNVWVVFDKDEFKDFDEAIELAEKKGYKVAWSNQSFEYFIYLHFYYSDSALHRDEWNKKLDEIFKERNIGQGKYKKNYVNLYELISENGGIDTAIANAKRRMANFNIKKEKPSLCDPATTVHNLIIELKKYLE